MTAIWATFLLSGFAGAQRLLASRDPSPKVSLFLKSWEAREFQNYLHHDKLVEGVQDVHGNYNVVRMTNGIQYQSKLPDHILGLDPRQENPKEMGVALC